MAELIEDAQATTIRLHPSDNVVVASSRIAAGARISGEDVRAAQAIPSGHKIAVRFIAAGQPVLRYGQAIGAATEDIPAGAHVHVHNLAVSDVRLAAETAGWHARNEPARTFQGYHRPGGKVGVRNYVGVLTSVNCSATVARMIAEAVQRSGLLDAYPNVDGVVPITHTSGCGMADKGEGYDLLRRTLWGTAANPNFGGILLVGLGCEVIQIGKFAKDYGLAGRDDFQSFTIQDVGGTRKAVEEGLARLKDLLAVANTVQRAEAPASRTGPGSAVRRIGRLVRRDLQPGARRRRRPAGQPGGDGDPVGDAGNLWRRTPALRPRRLAGGVGQAARAAGLVGALHHRPRGADGQQPLAR